MNSLKRTPRKERFRTVKTGSKLDMEINSEKSTKKDIYEVWTPDDEIPARIHIEGIYDDREGFRILLSTEDSTKSWIRISFDSILGYRWFDEGDRMRTIDSLAKFEAACLYIVKQSTFTDWFLEENYKDDNSKRPTHFAIFTSDECIDILSFSDPQVIWL